MTKFDNTSKRRKFYDMRGKSQFILTILLSSSTSFSSARSWIDIVSQEVMAATDSSALEYQLEEDPLQFLNRPQSPPATISPVAPSPALPALETAVQSSGPVAPSTGIFPSQSLPSSVETKITTNIPISFDTIPSKPTGAPSATKTYTLPPVRPPTLQPTPPPTSQPTPEPTEPPTVPPTQSPTISTAAPVTPQTAAPTINPYPENPVPDNPSSSYFNYDTRRSEEYGPGYPEMFRYNETTIAVGYRNNGWATREVPDNFYWDEFDEDGYGPWQGTLARRDLSRNRCDRVGKQSPIDLRSSGAECIEHHEVRSRPGDFSVNGNDIEKRIESNKLRLVYRRRPCANITDVQCSEPDPPHADFPNNWGGYADLMHVDFKIPSEHLLEGQRLDAEMQIFHLHPGRKRMPTVSSLINATASGYNIYLQAALDAFEYVYNVHRAECAAKTRRERKLISEIHKIFRGFDENIYDYYSTWADFSTDLDSPDFIEGAKQSDRKLQYGVWDPHHSALVPSIHFYGYDGSLTEPPCGEFISWFVCDKPMTISFSQLEQMKRLLFTHIGPDCTRTSVHYRQSVARPIQDTGGRPVWHCTADDFGPD